MFKLLNLRLGFANNSSSSHSIVFLKNPKNVQDEIFEESMYSWDHFTAVSKTAKENYLICNVIQDLNQMVGSATAKIILAHLLGRNTHEINDGWVDHQSKLVIPKDFYANSIDIEYFQDLHELFSRENVAILGGEDNSGDSHDLIGESVARINNIPKDYHGDWVARKDGDVWILFNRNNGHKMRFAFEQDIEYTKSSYPELVDIKITDFCPYNCPFCYQGSTTAGKHASLSSIVAYATLLSKHKVFEVAIGGGEPTLHPDFVEILHQFRRLGVVPNFTTRNLAWLRSDQKDKILNLCGSFAVSTESCSDIEKLAAALKYHDVPSNRATLQFIAGATRKWEFKNLMQTAINHGLDFTILGFKETGRGTNYNPAASADECWDMILSIREKHPYIKFGIDTVFAEQVQHHLVKMTHPVLYHTKDGVFSCYIDAINETIAPSSYCNANEYKPLTTSYNGNIDDFGSIFRSFR